MSSRQRILAVVAVCAVAAGATAGTVAWVGRGATTPAAAEESAREGAPPLALDVLVEDAAEATELQRAIRLYQDGRRGEARSAFERVLERDPESLYAAVGVALSRWPDGTLADLGRLASAHPESALVRLHQGLALFWLRQDAAAKAAWQEAETVEPDSAAALRAESLLHPEMPQARPFFVPGAALGPDIADLQPLQQLAALEARAKAEGTAEAWILYGVALQRAGRPVSAVAAFDRAVEADPESAEAQAGAAVARFDKDDPSRTFSRLGPLSQRFPDAAVVRFHLGLCLLWLSDVAGAREQLEQAAQDEPQSIWGQEAARLLERLEEAGAGGPAEGPTTN